MPMLMQSSVTQAVTMLGQFRKQTEQLTCTNVVADSLCTHSAVSAGLAMQLMTAGTKGSISRLPIAPQASVRVLIAWACRQRRSSEV